LSSFNQKRNIEFAGGAVMKTKVPFLLRFARPCRSDAKAERKPDYVYDDVNDIVRWLGRADHPPAIVAAGEGGPKTKKQDIEKGEDQKDRRMWRLTR
jgi:hypothetical protein